MNTTRFSFIGPSSKHGPPKWTRICDFPGSGNRGCLECGEVTRPLPNEGYRKTGLCLFGFGAVLTALWIFNNVKTYRYLLYWWEVLKEIEAYDDWQRRPDYVSKYDERRKRLKLGKTRAKEKWWQKYSNINNVLAPIFFAVVGFFLALIGYLAVKPCHS